MRDTILDLLTIGGLFALWALLYYIQARRNRNSDQLKGKEWQTRSQAYRWDVRQKGLK